MLGRKRNMLTSRLAPSAQGDALPVLLNCGTAIVLVIIDMSLTKSAIRLASLIVAALGVRQVRQRQMPSNIGVERFMRAA